MYSIKMDIPISTPKMLKYTIYNCYFVLLLKNDSLNGFLGWIEIYIFLINIDIPLKNQKLYNGNVRRLILQGYPFQSRREIEIAFVRFIKLKK